MGLLFSKAKLLGQPYRWGDPDFVDGAGGSLSGSAGNFAGGSFDGADNSTSSSSPAVVDAVATSPAPNAGMSPADQISSYSQARERAEAAVGMGQGTVGGYSPSAGSVGQREAFLQGLTDQTPAQQIDAARPGPVATVVNTLLGLVGVATGTPTGVLAGGRTLAGVVNSSGILVNANAQASDLGFLGNLGAGTFGTSSAPVVIGLEGSGASLAGASFMGPAESGMGDLVGGSPVLGFSGELVNSPSVTGAGSISSTKSPAAAAAAAALRGRYAPPPGPRQPEQNPAPWLVLAGLASFLFMG